MEEQGILYAREDGIGSITFSQPDKLNALPHEDGSTKGGGRDLEKSRAQTKAQQ